MHIIGTTRNLEARTNARTKDIEDNGVAIAVSDGLYLGKVFDPATEQAGDEFRLRPSDLTTHGIVIGMTGSGKTGLSIVLIEEALQSGIPVIVMRYGYTRIPHDELGADLLLDRFEDIPDAAVRLLAEAVAR